MEVRQLIGIPWANEGSDFTGANCWGLARLARRVLDGKDDLPAYDGQFRSPAQHRREIELIMAQNRDGWVRVLPGCERRGDFMLMMKLGCAIHVGYIIKRGVVLHIEEGINSMTERYPSLQIPLTKIEGIYRYG
jgi:hypothetical protein